MDGYDPEKWIYYLLKENYRSAVFPLSYDADEGLIKDYVKAANENDILIAEVGAWSNPISKDLQVRKAAIEHCKKQLELAEMVGARCCVNIAGSRGEQWDGPAAENFTSETFELIVDSIREIIDTVKPKRTFYTLETMPWIFPDCAESYLELIKAVDRKEFAVHFDPVNMITSPRVYYRNGEMIKEFIAKLGPFIKSCHAKDIIMSANFMVHLDETSPGAGILDYKVLLYELNKLDRDMPIILEHLSNEKEYRNAAAYIRNVAKELNIPI
ncbi:sugar phosphate isomerase/epimerase [Anoxybacillus tepidamans]|uniref:Sugar phosphate isomerase/epimerase n=1 Tax=Anoxybacteroides tepidamans TaxID=265948 RepID=A0A7W8MVV6_9BACL|nr:TIM barrel protein [Anoxybacillus tepidamans]MBB5325739.1 sugar phosphate isomerase/epimerase [Anoxybacillus tepidamans]